MKKNYKCPHCGKANEVDVQSWDESLEENLPSYLAKGTMMAVAGAFTAGLGAIALGVVFTAHGTYKYIDGTAVTCGACKKAFKI